VTVNEHDKGKVVTVPVSALVTLVLHNTYWTIHGSSDSRVLESAGPVAHNPGSNCLPGVGCGTVSQSLRAVAPGVAHLGASRTVCGEALACSPGDGSYDVVIHVTRK
jgi:hypothetical protein